MMTSGEMIRRSAAFGTALLILTLSVVVPVLERADLGHAPVVESEHSPADCPRGHDHTVCTQVGANLAALVERTTLPVVRRAFSKTPPVTVPRAVSASFVAGHRSRAPPLG